MKKINKCFIFILTFYCIGTSFTTGYGEDTTPIAPRGESLSGYPLSVNEAIRLTLSNNFDIHMARIERKVNVEDVGIAKAVYDTLFSAQADYTYDEKELVSFLGPYYGHTTKTNVSLSKQTFWGMLFSLAFAHSRNSSSPNLYIHEPYYTSDIEVSAKQSLLKNGFGFIDRSTVTLARLNVSKLDLDILDRIEAQIHTVLNTYWDLVFAYGNLEAKKEAVQFAEEFLKTTQKQFDNGAAEETDLFAAKANVEQSMSNLLDAHVLIKDTADTLKLTMNFFEEGTLRPTETPRGECVTCDVDTCLLKAFNQRRDLKARHIALEAQNITVKMKKNSRLPELDLTGTFNANGISRDALDTIGESIAANDPTYFVGLEMSIPLENRKARGEFKQADLEKARAIWDIKKAEKDIRIDIQKSIRAITLKSQQLTHLEKVLDLQRKKLDGEDKKYSFGRSSSDIILRYETDVINARVQLMQTQTEYEKALTGLKRNENALLDDVDWVIYEPLQSENINS